MVLPAVVRNISRKSRRWIPVRANFHLVAMKVWLRTAQHLRLRATEKVMGKGLKNVCKMREDIFTIKTHGSRGLFYYFLITDRVVFVWFNGSDLSICSIRST